METTKTQPTPNTQTKPTKRLANTFWASIYILDLFYFMQHQLAEQLAS